MIQHRKRSNRGQLSEFGASLAVVLPITIYCLFVAAETAQLFMINSALKISADRAARLLSIAYMSDPADTMANPEKYFAQVKFLNLVQSSKQFSIPAGTAGWNTDTTPPTVTVQVTFASGQNGSPVLPNPDPLLLSPKLVMNTTATTGLE